MHGAARGDGRGIVRRAVDDLFAAIETDESPRSRFLVRASYLQIYNEVCESVRVSAPCAVCLCMCCVFVCMCVCAPCVPL